MIRWGSRITDMLAATLVAGFAGFGLAAPAAAYVAVQPDGVGAFAMGPGRIGASAAVVMALIGAISGGMALARSGRAGAGTGRRGAVTALVLGPVGLAVGALVVAGADGGVGTGHGFGGGVVAMVVGLIAMTLGGLALARARVTT